MGEHCVFDEDLGFLVPVPRPRVSLCVESPSDGVFEIEREFDDAHEPGMLIGQHLVQHVTRLGLIELFPPWLADLGNFHNLVELALTQSRIGTRQCDRVTHLPDAIGSLRELKIARFDLAYLCELGASVYTLENLEVLTVTRTEIPCLPEGISALGKLEELHLEGNRKLAALPAEMARMTCLHTLDLQDTAVGALPSIRGLSYLDLSRCRLLRALPKCMGRPGSHIILPGRPWLHVECGPDEVWQLVQLYWRASNSPN